MHNEVEALELELLLTAISRRYGYDFHGYSRPSLMRRLRRVMQVEGVRTLSGLQERLLHDPDAIGRFISALTVRVTGMFRDAPVYRYLRREVMPILRTYPFVRIWHAGCSSGEEVYSLAILLAEEGLLDRSRIYATDLSDDLLERARRGVYPLDRMRDYTQAYIAAGGRDDFSRYYVADDENVILSDRLRSRMVFSQHNLASDGSFNEFHLVFCRNVLIYFADDLRDRVYALLHGSLVRFGVLALGLRESMRYNAYSERFEALNEQLRIYRRIA